MTADQQTRNAQLLVDGGGAVLVPDGELDGARLAAEVDRLLADPAGAAAMAASIRTWARPDAADAIAALAEEHAVPDAEPDAARPRRAAAPPRHQRGRGRA